MFMSSEELSKRNIQFIEHQIDAVMNPVEAVCKRTRFSSTHTTNPTLPYR